MKFRIIFAALAVALALTSCEKPVTDDDEPSRYEGKNVILRFSTAQSTTRSSTTPAFTKLNLMLFNSDGEKAFDKVKTQTIDDEDFSTFAISIPEGTYTVVAVAHSSIKSATIKSLEMVQFTAADGEKLTDTFLYCDKITVGNSQQSYDLTMKRVCAMFRLTLTDDPMPASVAKFKFDYTGGSANFNPSTTLGCTKSTQAENRTVTDDNIYEVYTFPYMATTCTLKMTVSALDENDNVLSKRVFENVSVTKNRITEYKGQFFSEDPGSIQPVTTGFTANTTWDGFDTQNF